MSKKSKKQKYETRSEVISVGDSEAIAALFNLGGYTGDVTESRALGITALYRAVSIVSGTIAGLPLKTYQKRPSGERHQIKSFLDSPSGPYNLTQFAWTELVMTHLLIRGEAFLLRITNNAGALIGLYPIHPAAVEEVDLSGYGKDFKVRMADGSLKKYDDTEILHITGLTTDGIRGVSPISTFRNTLQLSIAGDNAASRMLTSGLSVSGLATPNEDIPGGDAQAIADDLNEKLAGPDNAGRIAVVNKALHFTPWTMTASDAEFIAQRSFSVEEVSRMFGVPLHLLGQTDKQTSWGTGVAEQNLGLARYTLNPWTQRIEQALTQLLGPNRYAEFEYVGLLQGTPGEEIRLLIEQVEGGLLLPNEARAIRNLPPIEGGDEMRSGMGAGILAPAAA